MSNRDYEILGKHADRSDDDLIGEDVSARAPVSKDAQIAATRAIIKQAQASRLPPPPLTVEPATGDVGEVTADDDDVLGELLGIAEAEGTSAAAFTPVASADFPLTQRLYQRYQSTMPTTKIVRVDTEESYGEYMNGKRAPYLVELEQRLEVLEAAVAEHVADKHSGGRVERLEQALAKHASDGHGVPVEVLGAEIEAAKTRAQVCGEEIPLSLPPGTEKNVKTWQDGEQIYCSMRMPGPDGKAMIATTSTPYDRHVEEVLSYAIDANVDPVEIMGVLPALAKTFGSGSLITQLSRAADDLRAQPGVRAGKPFVGKVTPTGDPAVAAVMHLLQLCAQGDKRACKEAAKLKNMPGGAEMFAAAERGIAAAKGRA